jgi:hypothetical protein
MAVMIRNSDIPDGWEREAEDPQYFYKFSPDAYSSASSNASTNQQSRISNPPTNHKSEINDLQCSATIRRL